MSEATAAGSNSQPVAPRAYANGAASDIQTQRRDWNEEQWREALTPMEYHVLREAGTEAPGSGTYLHEKRVGIYRCRACGAELFRSETKFDSGCGWPSFYDPCDNAAVTTHTDTSHGMVRTEVRCANCDSHLGHVFLDAPQTPTGQRYCMNSICLDFVPQTATTGSTDEHPEPTKSGDA